MTFRHIVPVAAAVLMAPGALPAQSEVDPPAAREAAPPVPFGTGELMTYDVRFGPIHVGEGTMEVVGTESIRGHDAWHTRFRVKGGLAWFHVDDVLESWIDREAFTSLRFVQDFEEGGRNREHRYEIFPERETFREDDKPEEPSVAAPLDDGSFLYFVRTVPLEVGQTYTFNRYFRPDRNPVIVKVLRRERVNVGAGTFQALVIQPIIKSRGIFSEDGEALIWLSDDKDRIMVQMKTRTKIGSLNLFLKSRRPPGSPTP